MTTGTGSFDSQPHPQGRIGGSLAALRARVFSDAAALEREEPAAAATASPAEATAAPRDPIQQWNEIALRTFITVGIFSVFVNLLMLTMPIYLFQISDRVLTSRSLDTLRHAVAAGARLHRRPVAARHPAPPGARPAGDQDGDHPRRPGARQHRHDGASQRRRQHAAAAQPAPGARASSPARPCCCCSMRRWRRSISPRCSSSIPTSASSRSAAGVAADRHRRRQPARDVGSARPGGRLRVQGRRAGRCAGAQLAGHQRHGHAQRKHSALGPRAGQRPDQADGRARSQLLDQRRLAVLAPGHADRRSSAGAPIWRWKASSPAA